MIIFSLAPGVTINLTLDDEHPEIITTNSQTKLTLWAVTFKKLFIDLSIMRESLHQITM